MKDFENFLLDNAVLDPKIKERFVNGIYERDLLTYEEAGFSKELENISERDLIAWTQQAIEHNIDPSKIVASCTDLNYNYKNKKYKFKSVYLPINIIQMSQIKVNDILPSIHFNYLAGNYHRSRYKLLEKFWQKGFLNNDDIMLWTSYRYDKFDDNLYNVDFLDYMKKHTPKTFMESTFYNATPEMLGMSQKEQQWLNDLNNKDTWIFDNSLISIVIDTFASLLLHKVQQNYTTTRKTFKAIKHKRPFILTIGTQGNDLKKLKRLGFKTFGHVWDESYDREIGIKRLDAIADLCYNLSNRSVSELYKKTKEVCEYNYNILQNTDWVEWYFNELDNI